MRLQEPLVAQIECLRDYNHLQSGHSDVSQILVGLSNSWLNETIKSNAVVTTSDKCARHKQKLVGLVAKLVALQRLKGIHRC